MDKLSAREILAIGQKYDEGVGISASVKPPEPLSLPLAIEDSDFVVHALVDDVTLDVSDLKEAILNPNPYGMEDWVGLVKTTIDLSVLEVYPSLPAEFGDKISFLTVVTTEELDMFENGKEYLIGLRQYGDTIWMPKLKIGTDYMEKFVCPVDPNSGIVSGFKYGPMLLDEAWALTMDTYDAVHEGILPSDEVLDYWLARLKSDDLTDCWSAVDYFGTLAEPIVPQELVAELVERYLDTLGENYRAIMAHGRSLKPERRGEQWSKVHRMLMNDAYEEISFLTDALEMLVWVADESNAERILSYYEKDAPSSESIFNWDGYYQGDAPKPLIPKIVRLVLKHPGPKRRERFLRLVSCRPRPKLLNGSILVEELGRTEGEDIDRLLMEMMQYPATFGIDRRSELRGYLWETMARRGQREFGDYLEQFLADPNESDLVKFKDYKPEQLDQAIKSAEDLFNSYYATQAEREDSRKRRLQDLVDQYRSGESEIRDGENWTVHAISEVIRPEDTEFLGVLVEGANQLARWRIHGIAIRLADPCFVPVVRKAVEQEVTSESIEALYVCGAQEEAVELALAKLEDEASGPIIRFLGTTSDTSVFPVVEDFTREEVIELYREESWNPHEVSYVQRNAVLALARLGGESAIPRLKELYESEDTDILVRI
ncbi:MAG: HEAT repeat domain-containing protein, partial [Planctomycetota bacterium]